MLYKLKSASAHPGIVGTSDMAMASEDGTFVEPEDAMFPFALAFQFNPAYRALFKRAATTAADTVDVAQMFVQSEFVDPRFCKVYGT
jgi:hypothetical protein